MMQILEGEYDLRAVEARLGLCEAAHATQVREHLSAGHELEYHEQV